MLSVPHRFMLLQASVPNVFEYVPLIVVTTYTSNMATMGAPSFMGFVVSYMIG